MTDKKIVFLGWGSLIWDLRELQKNVELDAEGNGNWRHGGPILPIEFSRISSGDEHSKDKNKGRLTLVIDAKNGYSVPTRFIYSTRTSLADAREDLRVREKLPTLKRVGYVDLRDNSNMGQHSQFPAQMETIKEWATAQGIDVVIWTDLGSNFDEAEKADSEFSVENALEYIKELKKNDPTTAATAHEYIRKAPPEVNTPFRRAYNTAYPA